MSELGPQAQDEDDEAPEVADVLADDRLVETVGSGELTAADACDEVVALLVAWRDHVDAGAVPLHPDLDEAEVALRAATRGARWRVPLRVLSPVAAAAAAVVVALTGIGWAAHQSTPGEPLWGVSQTLFAGHSRSVQAAANASAALTEAESAMASGTPDRARTALQRAAADLGAVGTDEGRQNLENRHAELQARLDGVTTPAPAPPPVAPAPAVAPPAPPSQSTVAPVTTTPTPPAAPVTTTPTIAPTTVAPTVTTTPPTDAAPSTTVVPPTPTDTAATTSGQTTPAGQPGQAKGTGP